MKIKTYISVIQLFCYSVSLLFICEIKVKAEKTDSLNFPVDTVYIQAIEFDRKTYNQFKNDKDFDYYQGKFKGYSMNDLIVEKIRDFLRKHFNLILSEKQVTTILWVVFVLVVITVILIFYFFKPSLFYINKKKKIDFSIENENIDTLDFESLINNALKAGQYAYAIRLNYLQILKTLHSKELISYIANKTVVEYVHEIKEPDIKQIFKEITQQFLYYRYGNFEATKENWIEFNQTSKKIR